MVDKIKKGDEVKIIIFEEDYLARIPLDQRDKIYKVKKTWKRSWNNDRFVILDCYWDMYGNFNGGSCRKINVRNVIKMNGKLNKLKAKMMGGKNLVM